MQLIDLHQAICSHRQMSSPGAVICPSSRWPPNLSILPPPVPYLCRPTGHGVQWHPQSKSIIKWTLRDLTLRRLIWKLLTLITVNSTVGLVITTKVLMHSVPRDFVLIPNNSHSPLWGLVITYNNPFWLGLSAHSNYPHGSCTYTTPKFTNSPCLKLYIKHSNSCMLIQQMVPRIDYKLLEVSIH